jgi:hypothetical protein
VIDRRRKATHDQTGSDSYDDCAHHTVISVGFIIVRRGFAPRRDITATNLLRRGHSTLPPPRTIYTFSKSLWRQYFLSGVKAPEKVRPLLRARETF